MVGLALRSVRHRAGSFLASVVSMFLGAVILMAFASLLDTAAGPHVPAVNASTLRLMATVVGGWGLLLVVFAVTSTLSLTVRQRAAEMALLRSAGATPAQVGRMIVAEAAVLALVSGLAAIVPAAFAGRALLRLLAATHQVQHGVEHVFGPIAIGMGLGITFAAATIGALLTARRAARTRVVQALVEATIDTPRMSRKRLIAGWAFLALGVDLGVVTATAMRGEGEDAMQTAGQASIWFAIGLALLSPALLRWAMALLDRPVRRLAGASGYLTVHNLRQRVHQMAGALMPIILFTGIATGTLYMQSIENAAGRAAGVARTASERDVETLNFVVVGMIVLFAAIMLINTLVATTTGRTREFGQLRLSGATTAQVRRMVTVESLVLTVTGVLFGTVASVVTVVPYSVARTGAALPHLGVGIYLGVVATALAVTLAASVLTARRRLRVSPVRAAAL